jgi:hypothetical protein
MLGTDALKTGDVVVEEVSSVSSDPDPRDPGYFRA